MNDDDWMMHVSWSPFLSDSEISESWSRNVQWGIFQAFHYVVLNWSGTFTDLSDFVFIKNCSLAILFCHSMVSFLNEQWQLRRPPLPHHDHSHTHSGTHSSLMQQYHLLASSRSLQIMNERCWSDFGKAFWCFTTFIMVAGRTWASTSWMTSSHHWL